MIISPLKWNGSKAKLIEAILEIVPQHYNRYFEPFMGSGSVMLNINPQKAYCSDIIEEPINTMQVIKDKPGELINEFVKYASILWEDSGQFYYEARNEYNRDKYSMPAIDKAAAIMFLLRSGFNGLVRFNKDGCWDVPWGKRGTKDTGNPIFNSDYEKLILETSNILNQGDKQFVVCSFEQSIAQAQEGDLVYANPHLNTDYNSYSGYDWTKEQEKLLYDELLKASDRGAKFILSNVYIYKGKKNKKLLKIFGNFHHTIINHQYIMGPMGHKRPLVSEILIYN